MRAFNHLFRSRNIQSQPNFLFNRIQDYLQEEESNVSSSVSEETDNADNRESQWHWPNGNLIKQRLATLDSNNECARAWLALLNFKARKHKGTPEWFPGDDIIESLMFCFCFNHKLSITREILQQVLDILLTLQEYGIIAPDIDIPKSAFTIECL